MNRQQNAQGTHLPQQEERAIAAFDIIEEQNNAVQAEFAITLKQSQNTILNLQNAQQALLLENAQSRTQITVLESQNNQMNAAHQADMKAALERNKTLEEALRVKCDEVNLLNNKVEIYKKTLSGIEVAIKPGIDFYDRYYAHYRRGPQGCECQTGVRDLIIETKQQLSNVS
jgi:hypothetical protein